MPVGGGQLGGFRPAGTPPTPTNFDTELTAYLSSVGITAYPLYTPQLLSFPAITYQLVGTDRPIGLRGAITLATARYQLSVWSKLLSDCQSLSYTLRQNLHGFGPGLWGNTTVQACFLSAEDQQVIAPIDASSQSTFQRVLLFDITYVEELPLTSHGVQ